MPKRRLLQILMWRCKVAWRRIADGLTRTGGSKATLRFGLSTNQLWRLLQTRESGVTGHGTSFAVDGSTIFRNLGRLQSGGSAAAKLSARGLNLRTKLRETTTRHKVIDQQHRRLQSCVRSRRLFEGVDLPRPPGARGCLTIVRRQAAAERYNTPEEGLLLRICQHGRTLQGDCSSTFSTTAKSNHTALLLWEAVPPAIA